MAVASEKQIYQLNPNPVFDFTDITAIDKDANPHPTYKTTEQQRYDAYKAELFPNGNLIFDTGKGIQTGTSVGNSFVFQIYDVDAFLYKTFITGTANNTPSLIIGAPSGGALFIDAATLGGNSPITISQASSITTTNLVVEDLATLNCPLVVEDVTISTNALTQKHFTANSGSAITIAVANGNSQVITMDSATPVITFPTALASGKASFIAFALVQDGTGGRVPSFVNANYPSGIAPSIDLTPGATTYMSLYCSPLGTQVFENGAPINFGTYTPTLTNTLNVSASTAFPCQWMKVGNMVTVSGMVNVDPTALSVTELDLSLPITSAFTQVYQAGGTGAATTTTNEAVGIIARTSSNRAFMSWITTELTNHQISFQFMYQIV